MLLHYGCMRSIKIYSASWYPGHQLLEWAVPSLEEKLPDVSVEIVNVDDNLIEAEQQKIVTIPTVVLFKDGESKRRMSGAVGLPEILGLAGVRGRARVISKPSEKVSEDSKGNENGNEEVAGGEDL